MHNHITIQHRQYTEVKYKQFQYHHWLQAARAIAGAITWPVLWPLAMLCRTSDMFFVTISELISILPCLFGIIARAEFYRFALHHCGKNIVIEFGTIFMTREISIGDNVLIGRYNTIHHCDFGNYVLTAEGCAFLSGSKYHRYDRRDIPMALQGGRKKRITVGNDCWIGAKAILMDDIGHGAVVGAGSVVTKPVADFTVVVGNPARPLRQRGIN